MGDVVLLETGDKVPADMRLLYASSLKVENGSLTGESEPIELDAKYMPKHDIKIEECKNLAFNSSLILEGDGIGCVIATGDRTLIGRIASLTTTVTERPSTMKIEGAWCGCTCGEAHLTSGRQSTTLSSSSAFWPLPWRAFCS